MLSVPQLDDLSFEKLFERARGCIPAMTEEWTDFNAHDPGITTLQTFAWLSDTLNYYMNATGEAHRLKYFKLLGIEPKISCAHCTLEIRGADKKFNIPRGTRFDASGTVFEAGESYSGKVNTVNALYRSAGDKILDITHLAGVDGGFAQIFSYETNPSPELYIGFENALKGEVKFYVQVEKNERRNSFPDDFSLVSLKWEYFDGIWKEAEVVSDGTNGFLRSGYITLKLDGETALSQNPMLKEAHYLRCTLEDGSYDILPNLGKIAPACIEVFQTDTYAQASEYVYNGCDEVPIDYCLSEENVITVALEGPDGFVTWFDPEADYNALCEIADGEYSWQKVIRFDEEKFGVKPAVGQKILVLITTYDIYEQLTCGSTMGCSEEKIDFSVDNVYELTLALVRNVDGKKVYEIWHNCDDMDKAGYADKVFHYNEKLGQIIFGDGLNGMQPYAGSEVRVVTLKTSSFENGNVMKGQVNKITSQIDADIEVENLQDARDGKRINTLEELQVQLEEKLQKVTRAVTQEDYVDIVKNTPGLMIDYVNVITAKEYEKLYGNKLKSNTVVVAVKPHTNKEHSELNGRTGKIILDNLENYRLLTTNIELASPSYVGVGVYGRIALTENTPYAREKVMELLRSLIDFRETGGFGKSVAYGKVFSKLEMLDEVKGVLNLNFEITGRAASKNESGDIVVYPDGLAFLRSSDIEFT